MRRARSVQLFLALAIAVASVHFSTHSIRPATIDADLLRYLADGWSLADLCLSGEFDYHQHGDCPFCREADLVAVLGPSAVSGPVAWSTGPVAVPVARTPTPPSLIHAAWPRAPPIA